MKRRSRLLCWLLTGLMITTSCPVTAYAEQTTQFQEEVEQEQTTDVSVEMEELENSKASSGDFTFTVAANGTDITITKYKGSDIVVDLSQVEWVDGTTGEPIEGAKVVAISASAFQSSGISKIILPGTLTKIGQRAFEGCKSLSSVSFSDKDVMLAVIDSSAFAYCNVLSDFVFPETLISIGEYAFTGTPCQ